MSRALHLDIGLNGAFLTRRWEDPGNWMRLTAELGFPWHEFCGDVLDPFFSGDPTYQFQTAAAVHAAAAQHKVKICDVYTGMATHRFHGLSHAHESVRARMRSWIIQCMDLALAMGADRIGGHWDALSVEVLADKARQAETKARTAAQFRELAAIAKHKGLAAIYNEQMYIPSEVPWTIAEGYEFLEAANKDSVGVPVYLTVDVGHQGGVHYGAKGEDLDYRAWLRHFAPVSEIVHVQQTTRDASQHWPFTAEYNQKGHISVQEVLDAIRHGHEAWNRNPLAGILKPVERTILVAEIIPGSTKTEEQLLAELKETGEYLRRFVPEKGLVWTFE